MPWLDLPACIVQVFSECIELTNVTGHGRNLSACVALESRLMCFKSRCVYKATDPFGCFHPVHPARPSLPTPPVQ